MIIFARHYIVLEWLKGQSSCVRIYLSQGLSVKYQRGRVIITKLVRAVTLMCFSSLFVFLAESCSFFMQMATLIRPNEKFETRVFPCIREGYRRYCKQTRYSLN